MAIFDPDTVDSVCMKQSTRDLRRQAVVKGIDEVADVVGHIPSVQAFSATKSRVEDILQVLEDLYHDFVLGKRAMPQMIDAIRRVVGTDDRVGESRKLFFEPCIRGHSVSPTPKRRNRFCPIDAISA
jgi:single-stranded DNA-specific DHH superfamily exonuclease